jgi:hypothetical protein
MFGVSRDLSQQYKMLPSVPLGANAELVGSVYSNNSPFIEKIQAFEKFFTRHIDLYDKVRAFYQLWQFTIM